MIQVLVVEDDVVAADAHRMYVERVDGFAVAGVVHSGTEALRFLNQPGPDRPQVDLVLLDLYLPDGHGLQVCRSLRAAGHTADVIAVTSARDLAMVRQAVSVGVVQYLLKPFTYPTLRDRLEQYARFREDMAGAGQASSQDDVDRALSALRGPRSAVLPKGLSGPTLEAVTTALREAGEGLSAGSAGAAVGVSRITARRYLEHLVDTGLAERTPQYGQVGRPELCYRWAGATSP
ncbi:response regulator [Wenjunlia tyrosinilytica]|uniref:Transcriptional regulatory protein n=1 Tax=Wenjunlia tyrosinilytica TaxID=1544741 RepID=A0A918E0C9_9ACTN|nr:response regulator [Wenjunlia tyrosinilytica]GGO92848.1 transcriptional regulatory protein [Wenjunlia tyrosinilytica]